MINLSIYRAVLNSEVIEYNSTLLWDSVVQGFLLCDRMLTDSQENPELIWNDEARDKVSDVVRAMAQKSVPAKNCLFLCSYAYVHVSAMFVLGSFRSRKPILMFSGRY